MTRPLRRKRIRRDGAWLGLAALMFMAGVLPHALDDAPRSGGPADDVLSAPKYVRDPKVRRTATSFAMLASVKDRTPLSTFNVEGIAIDIELDERTWALMLVPGNRTTYKTRSSNVAIRFAGREPRPAVLSLRGGGSLEMPGKPCFDIKLLRPEQFTESVEMKRFYLMNMFYDESQIDHVWSYGLLAELGLFPLHYQFARVAVNGQPLGMYLLVEPPVRGLRRAEPGTVAVYRRRSANVFETLWSKGVPSQSDSLSGLRSLKYAEEIDDPVSAFREHLDLDAYLRWTAFNALILNHDTLDEVFLYEVRDDREQPRPLRVMAWDYDDIFRASEKEDAVDDPLIHSGRGSMDVSIVSHPELYERYRAILREMTNDQLPVETMVERVRAVQALRDSLDDGLPADVQTKARRRRARFIRGFIEDVRARHGVVREMVE